MLCENLRSSAVKIGKRGKRGPVECGPIVSLWSGGEIIGEGVP